MSDSSDQLQKLEEKLRRALELFKQNESEKRALQREVEKLRGESKGQAKLNDQHARELVNLRREREEVRTRIEKLLGQIDALTSTDSER